MPKKKKRRSPHKAAPDKRKLVNFLLGILRDALATVLAALIVRLLGL